MCQNKEKNTWEEQENDKIFSYTTTMSKKKTTMEMLLPYTSG
jgi:hypothetical protein